MEQSFSSLQDTMEMLWINQSTCGEIKTHLGNTIQAILNRKIEASFTTILGYRKWRLAASSVFCFSRFAFLRITKSTFDHGFFRWIFSSYLVLKPLLIWIQKKCCPLLYWPFLVIKLHLFKGRKNGGFFLSPIGWPIVQRAEKPYQPEVIV